MHPDRAEEPPVNEPATGSPLKAATRIPGVSDARAGATGREIAQQPEMWRRVASDLDARSDAVRGFLDPLLTRPDLRIVLTGAGTSAFVGEILAPTLARALTRRVDAVATTTIVSNPGEVFAEAVPTLLVSFARSGESPESIAATRLLDQCLGEAYHLIVTCNEAGLLATEHADRQQSYVLLTPPETNDVGFAMTSSFTSMVLAAWLALVPGTLESDVVGAIAAAAEAFLRERAGDVVDLASRGYERIVYLGSGPLAGLAREAALKVLELTAGRVVSFSESSLGFRHGPKSVINDRSLAIVFLSSDPYTRQYDEDIVEELVAQMGSKNVLVLTATPSTRLAGANVWVAPGLDDVPDQLAAVVFVVVAQLLALSASLALGITPDTPAPDGNVNRIVQGVTVHPYEQG
jgi:tagatose-6-phosphate ketose/aldose isomerase